MINEIIELKNIWVKYDGVVVLEDVNLTIESTNFFGIIGPNGGGKTTLLKVLLGLIKPSSGTVKVLGEDPRISRKRIGYVPQHGSFDVNYPISVWEVVMMGRMAKRKLGRRFKEEDKKVAEHSLEVVEMLNFKDRQISKLSGGQQQRVFIARALASNPEMLLLDEPTASVDKHVQTDIFELLKRLSSTIPIIMVSHDVGVMSIYVDKVACLNKRMFYHDSGEVTSEMLDEAYACPVEMIAHGVPHRVLKEHD